MAQERASKYIIACRDGMLTAAVTLQIVRGWKAELVLSQLEDMLW